MRSILALLLAVFAATASPATAEEAWQVFKPEGQGFAVEFPAPPYTQDQDVDLGDHQSAKMRTFQIRTSNTIYDVTVGEYPKGILQGVGEEQALDNARDGAVANAPGPLLKEIKIDYAGRKARELQVDMSMNLVARSRIFIVGDRMFNVGAITNKDRSTPRSAI